MALSTPSYEAWLDYPGAGPGVGWGTLTVGGRMFSKLRQRFIGPPPPEPAWAFATLAILEPACMTDGKLARVPGDGTSNVRSS
jgi:hypothetical protein